MHGEYESSDGKVTVDASGNLSSFNVKDMPIDFKIQATKGFSFHCTKLKATPILRGYNNSGNMKVYITFGGFQVRKFKIESLVYYYICLGQMLNPFSNNKFQLPC